MTKPFRKAISLATLVVVLVANLAPAADVCVCDPAAPRACCGKASVPTPEPTPEASGCCAAAPAEHASMRTHARVPASDVTTLSAPSCQRQRVTSEVSTAALPSLLLLSRCEAPAVLPGSPAGSTPSDAMWPLASGMRAPPSRTSLHLFLLNASFRI